MSKQNSYILGILATIVIGSFFYSKFCCAESCEKKAEKNNSGIKNNEAKEMINTFNISSENFEYSCEHNFNFVLGKFNSSTPIDKCIGEGSIKLKSFLDKNPNIKLKIIGYCASSEENNSAFPNLGFARANDVKNYFLSQNLTSNQFEIDGQISDNLKIENDVLIGPINFKLTKNIVETKGQDWKRVREQINASPLILYFNTNQSEINLSETERQKILDFSNYIDNVKDAQIITIGHTDNIGDRNVNLQLGQSRANFVKDYLVKNGINGSKIIANSKGPDEPIADNLTPEGRAKNRRTVVLIK